MGNISLAEDDLKSEVGVSEYSKEAEEASFRAQELTKLLITFSQGGLPIKKIGPIGDLLKESTEFVGSDSNVKYDFLIPHDLWLIDFDLDQMKHVVRNLIANAVESMPDGGSIKIKAENFSISSDTVVKGLVLSEGEYVKISIKDQGVGIPAEHLSLIDAPVNVMILLPFMMKN